MELSHVSSFVWHLEHCLQTHRPCLINYSSLRAGPYQVKLASGKLVMAPYDIDKFIRLRPDPLAPAAHGLLQAVKDAGVSDDQLLDTALKAVDKLADAFEVRDGNIDDCF